MIDTAIQLIDVRIGAVIKISSYYETEPWGFQADQNFVNAVIRIDTATDPITIIKELLDIEKELGRKRTQTPHYESRVLDLDIIAVDNQVIKTDDLCVPHPKMHLRAFVLIPFSEIEPNWRHPLINKRLDELIRLLKNEQKVNRLKQ